MLKQGHPQAEDEIKLVWEKYSKLELKQSITDYIKILFTVLDLTAP